MTDQIDIADLREKLAGATPGPWAALDYLYGGFDDYGRVRIIDAADSLDDNIAESVLPADAVLVAAAVNALPALLDEIERLRGDGA